MWLSTDDGETWTKTTTSLQPGGQLTARPDPAQPQPQPGDLVSLRVRGTDSDHNTVNQTIIRAYAIGPTTH